jgi:hypothetical protein
LGSVGGNKSHTTLGSVGGNKSHTTLGSVGGNKSHTTLGSVGREPERWTTEGALTGLRRIARRRMREAMPHTGLPSVREARPHTGLPSVRKAKPHTGLPSVREAKPGGGHPKAQSKESFVPRTSPGLSRQTGACLSKDHRILKEGCQGVGAFHPPNRPSVSTAKGIPPRSTGTTASGAEPP